MVDDVSSRAGGDNGQTKASHPQREGSRVTRRPSRTRSTSLGRWQSAAAGRSSATPRHDNTDGQATFPRDRRLFRIRVQHDPAARECGPQCHQGQDQVNTSCSNRSNTRPQSATCLLSLVARQATYSRFSTPLSKPPGAYAQLSAHMSRWWSETNFACWRTPSPTRSMWRSSKAIQYQPGEAQLPVELLPNSVRYMSRMLWSTPSSANCRKSAVATHAPWLAFL